MCNTHDKHAHQAHPPRPAPRSARLNPAHPTSRHARRARERKPYATPQNHRRAADPRNRTDLDAECDRSRHGLRPISMRSATDLDAELDRSRRGERPARFRPAIAPAQPGRPDVEARTTSSGAKATCRTSELSASSRSAAVRPISTRTTTDLEPELDRSRRGVRPISTRVTTGLEPELDRSRWP